jgi:DNA invertase Pin-like site-specific DNA recombinase
MTKPKAYSYIRFSTREQRHGSSVYRQTKQTESFANKYGLDLQDDSYADLGVSGFRGQHAKTGALAQFIEAVEAGKIARGSWLLIESLDRLGRDQINTAFLRFQSLLDLGITIATLGDQKVFRPEKASDITEILSSLFSMSRAHEESMRKSQLSAAAWEKTRETVGETGKAPAKGGITPWWLQKNKNGSFSEIPERVSAIQQMFSWALEGYGSTRLAKLMTKYYQHLDTDKAWTTGVISNLTRGVNVLGNWQPKKQTIGEDGVKRYEPTGEQVKLYPTIINEGLWLRVDQKRKNRDTITGRGASVKGTPNLFSGLLRCECGTIIRLQKDSFVCRSVEYGKHCDHRQGVSRPFFEPMLLVALQNYLKTHAVSDSSHDKLRWELDALETESAVATKEHKTTEAKLNNALELLVEDAGPLRARLSIRANGLEQELQTLSSQISGLQERRESVLAKLSQPNNDDEHIAKLLAEMIENDDGRHKVSQALRRFVKSMSLSGTKRQLTVCFSDSYDSNPLVIEWNKPMRGRLKTIKWYSSVDGSAKFEGHIEKP